MLTTLRYTLAAVCFAASVGCLALWWRGLSWYDTAWGPLPYGGGVVTLDALAGSFQAEYAIVDPNRLNTPWRFHSMRYPPQRIETKQFQHYGSRIFFPLWYPALIFALAGIGVLRFRRQFSIRSALIATTVTAAMIAMAVIL